VYRGGNELVRGGSCQKAKLGRNEKEQRLLTGREARWDGKGRGEKVRRGQKLGLPVISGLLE